MNGFGDYWEPIAQWNHNNYEEYPSLGVLAEGIRQALSAAAPGVYASSIAPGEIFANANLQGFRPLVNRRAEEKNFFSNLSIADNVFPGSIAHTGLSYRLVHAISSWLATSTTFKMNPVDLTHSENGGSNAQVVFEKSLVEEINPQEVCQNTDVRDQSMEKYGANTLVALLCRCFCRFSLLIGFGQLDVARC